VDNEVRYDSTIDKTFSENYQINDEKIYFNSCFRQKVERDTFWNDTKIILHFDLFFVPLFSFWKSLSRIRFRTGYSIPDSYRDAQFLQQKKKKNNDIKKVNLLCFISYETQK